MVNQMFYELRSVTIKNITHKQNVRIQTISKQGTIQFFLWKKLVLRQKFGFICFNHKKKYYTLK